MSPAEMFGAVCSVKGTPQPLLDECHHHAVQLHVRRQALGAHNAQSSVTCLCFLHCYTQMTSDAISFVRLAWQLPGTWVGEITGHRSLIVRIGIGPSLSGFFITTSTLTPQQIDAAEMQSLICIGLPPPP